MRRTIAALLVGAMTLQTAACTTTASGPPVLAAPPVATADAGVARAPAQSALSLNPPAVPTNEFVGSAYGGMAIGLLGLGVLTALFLIAK